MTYKKLSNYHDCLVWWTLIFVNTLVLKFEAFLNQMDFYYEKVSS